MTGFDTVLVVDWSAAQGVRRAERDSIWIGISRVGHPEEPRHMPTRHAAESWLSACLTEEIAAGRRVMAAFDFPFGYPAGFARHVTGSDDPLRLWDWLEAKIEDDARGRNNRFDVAEALNACLPGVGPFWAKAPAWERAGRYPGIPFRKKGVVDFAPMGEWRLCDIAVRAASSCFQLLGAQSVGGQALMGLPVLSRLRRILGVAAWPFEDWQDAPAVLIEIWPGLIEPAVRRAGGLRDREQVRLLAQALASLPAEELSGLLSVEAPEEGWILGTGQRERLTELAIRAI